MSASEITLPGKLVRHGNGYAIAVDDTLVKESGFDENTLLAVTLTGGSLIVTEVDPEREKRFDAAVRDTFRKYDKMMKRLAE